MCWRPAVFMSWCGQLFVLRNVYERKGRMTCRRYTNYKNLGQLERWIILFWWKEKLSFLDDGVNIHDRRTVTAFHYDSTGKTQGNTYTPDVDTLNRVISEWAENGIEFAGFVHSHPRRNRKLSPPDIEYANKIKDVCDMPQIIMALYLPDSGEIFTYVL